MAVYAAQYQINIKVPHLGKFILHPILLNFHLKLGIRIKLASVLLKNIFQTFIEKLLRVSNKNRTFVLKK